MTKKIDTQAALQALSQASSVRDALLADKARLEQEQQANEARRRALMRAPLPMDCMKALAIESIDAARAAFLRGDGMAAFVRQFVAPSRHRPPIEGPRSDDPMRRVLQQRDFGLNLQDVQAKTFGARIAQLGLLDNDGNLNDGAMCLLFGDQIKALLDEHFERWAPKFHKPAGVTDEDAAMPLDERLAELEKLDQADEQLSAQLRDVEGQIEQIDLAMKGAPVSSASSHAG